MASQNIIYDKIASDELLQSELNSINISQGLIIEGQIIVNKGEIVNSERYQKLLSISYRYTACIISINGIITSGSYTYT